MRLEPEADTFVLPELAVVRDLFLRPQTLEQRQAFVERLAAPFPGHAAQPVLELHQVALAGPDATAEHNSALTNHVQCGQLLGQQHRIVVEVRHENVAGDLDPRGLGGHGSHSRDRAPARLRQQAVTDRNGVEAELLAQYRKVDQPVQVVVEPLLWHEHAGAIVQVDSEFQLGHLRLPLLHSSEDPRDDEPRRRGTPPIFQFADRFFKNNLNTPICVFTVTGGQRSEGPADLVPHSVLASMTEPSRCARTPQYQSP